MSPNIDSQLFLDRRLTQSVEGLELAIAPCVRHPSNPLTVDGRKVWTKKNLMVSLHRDLATGEYSGWRYENIPTPEADDDGPAFPMRSDDGLAWRTVGKPIPMGAVMVDQNDPDSGRRFKMIQQGWAELDNEGELTRVLNKGEWMARGGAANKALRRGVFALTSADAKIWRKPVPVVLEDLPPGQRWWTPGTPGWAGGDNFPCVVWAPEIAKYVAFYRTNIFRGERARRERGCGRSESADFEHWGPHELALHARTTWQRAMGHGAQDYYQIQVWRCGGIYLGIISVFYWKEDRVRLELAWSPDTRHWERVCPGTDLIPHGELGEHDGGCRYAALGPVSNGDEVRVYYGGDAGRHNADPLRDAGLCLATFRRDRFAGLRPKAGTSGRILTRPVEVSGRQLVLNADGSSGCVNVELMSEDRRAIPGFERDQCVPIDSDELEAEVTWRTGKSLAELNGEKIRLACHVDNATLYSFGFKGSTVSAAGR